MNYFDVELIDISDKVENFKFEMISEENLQNLLDSFISKKDFLEFQSKDINIVLRSEFFRGILYTTHIPKKQTTAEENKTDSVAVSHIKLKKNKPMGGVLDIES